MSSFSTGPIPGTAGAARMHEVTEENVHLIDRVIDFSRRRLLASEIPLDKPMSEKELSRLVNEQISEDGMGADRALSVFEHILSPACISTDHPQYLAFIPSAPTKAAQAFDMAVSATALYGGSWMEGSGVVHAENETLRWLAGEFGLPESAGGVFVQGGTTGNLSALVAARDDAKRKRSAAGKPRPEEWIVVCSEEAHSSIASAAAVMDVTVVTVPTGEDGVLHGDHVRPALEEHGDAVFAVVATAGSTNFGLVDDLRSVADLKREVDFWFHVDGAYGLAAILSPLARARFDGVAEADSVIVDPHKWLYTPFDSCALLYRDPETGRRAHTQHAAYLDTLNEAPEWNPSDYAIQLTRRARGLPLWFSLSTYGAGAYRAAISHALTVAHDVADEIRSRPELRLVRDPHLSVVVFERIGWEAADYASWSEKLLDAQTAFVTPSSHHGVTNLRFAVLNPRTTLAQLTVLLDTLR